MFRRSLLDNSNPTNPRQASQVFSDIDLDFNVNPISGDISVLSDNRAIKASIRNIVLTSLGEKLFMPAFGTPINSLLFSPQSVFNTAIVSQTVKQAIEQFEPRVKVISVLVRTAGRGGDRFSFSIVYQIVGIESGNQETNLLVTRIR